MKNSIFSILTAISILLPHAAYAQVQTFGDVSPTLTPPNPRSVWTITGMNHLIVGNTGEGTLTITDGGRVQSASGMTTYIGRWDGSQGSVTIESEDGFENPSVWTNSGDLVLAGYDLYSASTGTATLTVGDGGVLTVGGLLRIHEGGVVDTSGGGNLQAGSVISSGTIVGGLASSSVTIVGGNATWELGDFSVDTTGEVNILEGGALSSTYGGVGGTMTVNGEGSQWNNDSYVYIDSGVNDSSSELRVEDGGVALNGGDAYIWRGAVSVSGEGSRWEHGNLELGAYYDHETGQSGLHISQGGVVVTSGDAVATVSVEDSASLSVADEGSRWEIDGDLKLESISGTSELRIENGGVVSDWGGRVAAYDAGSESLVVVTGEGSRWENGGSLSVSNDDFVQNQSSKGRSDVRVENGGVLTSDGGDITAFGIGAESVVTVSGEGSRWENAGELYMSNTGGGSSHGNKNELHIENGGFVSNGYTYLSAQHAGTETLASVTGNDSRWETSGFYVNVTAGRGEVLVEDGGVIATDGGYLGLSSWGEDSEALAKVSGAGSRWENSHMLALSSGNGSRTEFRIENGGFLSSNYGHSEITAGDDSETLMVVTGAGSRWEDAGRLEISSYGSGTAELRIENGGVLSNTGGAIGDNGGSGGVVTVSGAGSRWESTYDITVGAEGKGELRIENGGVVSANSGTIGDYAGASNVTVTGVGSQWNSFSLTVGFSGSGSTLTIEDRALAKVDWLFSVSLIDESDENYIRLDGGWLALYGDETETLANFIAAERFQLWDEGSGTWMTGTLDNFLITYYDTNQSGQFATGYNNLGGYTTITNLGTIPEPTGVLLLLFGISACLTRRCEDKN